MGIFEQANQAAVEAVAKRLQWLPHPTQTPLLGAGLGAPTTQDAGVSIGSSPKVMLHLPLREEPSRFSSRVQVSVLGDGTTTYRVTIDGSDVDYAATATDTEADVLAGLRDAINAFGPPVSTVVVASVRDTDADGVNDELLIRQINSETAEHATLVSVVAGPGALTANEDLSSASFRIWGLMAGTNAPTQWAQARGGVLSSVDRRGLFERLDSAGVDRIYLEVTAFTGVSGGGTVTRFFATIGKAVI